MRNPYGDGLRSRSRRKISDGARRTRFEERPARRHLEQVAALERIACHLDELRVLAGLVVAVALHTAVAPANGVVLAGPRDAGRRDSVHLEVVTASRRDLAPVVDDDDLVRQVQDEVALVVRTLEPQSHRLELEDEVVAERAVEAEVRRRRLSRRGRLSARSTVNSVGLLAPLLLGDAARRLGAPCPRAPSSLETQRRDARRTPSSARSIAGSSTRAAVVQRPDGERPRATGDLERRVDEAHVPARVAARVLVARREHDAAPCVERIDSGSIAASTGSDTIVASRDDPWYGRA